MPGQQHYPTELADIEAALAVRRDIQARAAAPGSPPSLGPSIAKARASLHTMAGSQIGDDVVELYRHLIDVAVSAESVAVRIRVAYPELSLEPTA